MNELDWNEPWEQALFKVVWANDWQRSRLSEISRLLSIVKDDLYHANEDDRGNQFLVHMDRALGLTKVTTVASTKGSFSTAISSDPKKTKDQSKTQGKEVLAEVW